MSALATDEKSAKSETGVANTEPGSRTMHVERPGE